MFIPAASWDYVPQYSLTVEKPGTVTAETLPYNGPGSYCGSYESCILEPGAAVYAVMACNGWYLCRFNNDHDNYYGTVYLWIPGTSIRWT